ncbi:hypothetical protein HG530_007195 [Fusarium avenaceum]|nr:hypothetical protein HG530_007195 [Fusarium avenaceum]
MSRPPQVQATFPSLFNTLKDMADLRQACDRCHSKKLRCTKIPGSSVCTRCVKAGVTCLFSPPSRSLRHPDNVAFDWSIFNMNTEIDSTLGVNLDLATTAPVAEEAASASPPQATVTEVSQLTDMMAALDRLHNTFPTSRANHLSISELNEFMQICKFDLGSFLEELLQRSQKLVHLYPEVLKRLKTQDSTCDVQDCVHNSAKYSQSNSRTSIDQSLVHLLLACHLRILDLFDSLVNHGRMCAQAVPLLPKDHEPNFDIPEIKIGSFVAPKVSAASMMIAMVIELQTSLNARAQQLYDAVSLAVGHESGVAKILGPQCEYLKERALETLTDLQSLRDSLTKLGLIG